MGSSLGNLGEGSYAGAYIWNKFQGRVSLSMGAPWGIWGGALRPPENLKCN